MNSMLSKFDGDFESHLQDISIPAVVKRGGSCLKTSKDALSCVNLPQTHNSVVTTVSAPSGVTQAIDCLFSNKKDLQNFSRKTMKDLGAVKSIYSPIFNPFWGIRSEWNDAVQCFRENTINTQWNDPQDYRRLYSFALGHFGELFTVEMLNLLAEKEAEKFSILPTNKAILLSQDFPSLPEDKFAPVSIDWQNTFDALKSFFPSSGPVLAPGFVAKNGLLGWNGSDTTAAILALFYYWNTTQVPRVIYQKDRPFQTSGRVDLVGSTKYSYFKREQSGYEQPFVHPQAIDLLDEPYSIPFLIEVPGTEYRLMVTSCSKLARSAGAKDYPAVAKTSGG